jgi:2,4-dienoyl-CoA reductase-like NADH-dependent reductase (Old Yellow Enzyme family)/thioredoxin reductase
MQMRYEHLFKPITLGSMQLANRIAMAPMNTGFGEKGGNVGDRVIEHYALRARGGAGLIIVEASCVEPRGRHRINQMGVEGPHRLDGLKRLVEAIHREGSGAAIQINHAGPQTYSSLIGMAPVVPWNHPAYDPECYMAKEADIEEITSNFVRAAKLSQESGFDAVEIHCANGYLLSSFISPFFNRRRDQFGGNTENRTRFVRQIVRGIRATCGSRFVVGYRMPVSEFIDGGIDVDEAIRIARLMAAEGVDWIHLTAGVANASYPESWGRVVPPMANPQGFLLESSKKLKSSVSVPVICAGRIVTPQIAEESLITNSVDMVALGRPLFADPDWPVKARSDATANIRPCIGCNECQLALRSGKEVRCTVNPQLDPTDKAVVQLATKPKLVIVAGAGPAGIQCALTAAARGHKVKLYESQFRLGGQLHLASKLPHKSDIGRLLPYFANALKTSSVEVHLGSSLTPEILKEIKADCLVIATGAVPLMPKIDGLASSGAISAWVAIENPGLVGKRVAIICGGYVGVETAEYLAENGSEVTVFEMLDQIAHDMESMTRGLLLGRLSKMSVRLLTQAEVIKVRPRTVVFRSGNQEKELSGFDTIVFATGSRSNLGIPAETRLVPEVHTIGGSRTPGRIIDAIRQGFELGRTI